MNVIFDEASSWWSSEKTAVSDSKEFEDKVMGEPSEPTIVEDIITNEDELLPSLSK